MSGWKIVHAIHDGHGFTVTLQRHTDGRVTATIDCADAAADYEATTCGQRIIRHDDGTCTIEDLPKPKTALELIEEWRVDAASLGNFAYVLNLDAIAEAIREGRAS